MPIELIKCQLFSLLKKRMYKHSTMKEHIVMRLFKGLDKNYYIFWKSLVIFLSYLDIRNVMVAVLIQQFHPLLPFECTNYRAIV